MNENTLTVSELNNLIKTLIDCEPMLNKVCVRGELSNYKIYPSGHHYFTLKDSESSLRCVMFKSSASKLRFRPESGMGVTAFGRVSVFPRDGAYQLYCTDLIPEGTGDLQIAFEQLKAKLASEGLFDPEHKKQLPPFPKKIAIITSSAGAAVHDMIRILGKRWPMTKVILLPVRVQGVEAPPEIVGAIRYANKHKIAEIIITGRGGGSIEDLWAFNDERVARAIYDSELPVISAVGHEPDVTISDYVADVRASTPSNAAEIAVPNAADMRELLENLGIRQSQAVRKKLMTISSKLEELKKRRVLQTPMAYVYSKRAELDYVKDKFIAAADRSNSEKRRDFVRLAASLDAMSPLKVLGRGYAIAADIRGELVRSIDDVKPDDKLRLCVNDGIIKCRVEESEAIKHE
ncbi:MAG: exodeoxyribonuclease VII large subunit [Oscillospiraceae bacterium]|nr:exodeoxyribonuclease VII large subunit [Oscillospiraceae bacterium]